MSEATAKKQRVLLSQRDLEEMGVPFHPMSYPRLVRQGRFPKPVKCGSRNMWAADEVEAWIEARKAERDKGAPSNTRAA